MPVSLKAALIVTTGFLLFLSAPLPGAGQQGGIEGVVLLGNQIPADDAEVALVGLGRRTPVAPDGTFGFAGVPAGTYVLEASSPRWGRAIESVTVVPARTVRVELMLESVFHLDEIVVSAAAGMVQQSEASQPASVVTSRDLVTLGEASLGETLSSQVGVNSTFYGPGASRPVIRGLGGDRVRILESGIGVGDASSTSPDHAVATDARSADRIEVIRGPATLLYGSAAIGGVVNVLESRIAREEPTEAVEGYAELLGGTVADERTGSARLSVALGDLVLTGSGLWRRTDDYTAPQTGGPRAVVPNSALDGQRGSLGLSYVGDRGYLGFAWSGTQSDYGIPGSDGAVIELDQTRVDADGTLRMPSGALRDVRARVGVADYRHVEMEGDEVGTIFLNDYVEGRVDAQHRLSERAAGTVGAQFSLRDFEAIGAEAFVPPSRTRTFALFAHESYSLSEALRVQAGLRFEQQRAEAEGRGVARSDNGVSVSAGLNWDASDALGISLSLSRSAKLPNAEELFSNGPHAATRAFEVGNPDLGRETAFGVDLGTHLHLQRFRGSASLFATSFNDYIHEQATGPKRDGLIVYEFVQGDALFAGLEIEGEVDLIEGDPAHGSPHVSLEFSTDYVAAELSGGQSLPRIPPLRFGGGLNYRLGSLTIRGSAQRTTRQTRIGPFEQETPGFTMADASASYRLHWGNVLQDITLVATNLTNSRARLHTSFLRDVAPLPGREIRLILRTDF